MKKNTLIIILGIATICLIIINGLFLSRSVYSTITEGDISLDSSLAFIYVEDDEGNYTEFSDESYLPLDGYTLNLDESYCLAGGNLSYNDSTYEVTMSSEGADKCFLYYDKTNNFMRVILADNGGIYSIEELTTYSDSEDYVNPFSKIAVTQEYYDSLEDNSDFIVQNGMYKTEDNYGDSYYFRGGDLNNYVEFAGLIWRIVRIDGQGNVKLVINDTTASTITSSLTSTKFSSGTGTLELAGYMYTSNTQYGTSTDSEIKKTIDTWYKGYLINYSDYLADGIFCVDRTWYSDITGSILISSSAYGSISEAYSGAYTRLFGVSSSDYNPTLKCNSVDAFTVTAVSNESNGALTYPIALLTADEATFAGLVSDLKLINDTSSFSTDELYADFNYLFKYGNPYYLLSPYTAGRVYSVWGAGFLTSLGATYKHDALIAISLDKDVLYSSGDGSLENPYTVTLAS